MSIEEKMTYLDPAIIDNNIDRLNELIKDCENLIEQLVTQSDIDELKKIIRQSRSMIDNLDKTKARLHKMHLSQLSENECAIRVGMMEGDK